MLAEAWGKVEREDGVGELRVGELEEICEFARRRELTSSRLLGDQEILIEWSGVGNCREGMVTSLKTDELREEVRISAESAS